MPPTARPPLHHSAQETLCVSFQSILRASIRCRLSDLTPTSIATLHYTASHYPRPIFVKERILLHLPINPLWRRNDQQRANAPFLVRADSACRAVTPHGSYTSQTPIVSESMSGIPEWWRISTALAQSSFNLHWLVLTDHRYVGLALAITSSLAIGTWDHLSPPRTAC